MQPASPPFRSGKILQLHFCESDKHEGKPLHEAILAKCRDLKIAGATVFRGLEGYGAAAEIRRQHLVSRDQPIVVVVVDSPENIDRLRPIVEDMIPTGVVIMSRVEMTRVQRSRSSPTANDALPA